MRSWLATHALRDWLAILLIALLVNTLVALLLNQPGYTDAYYYFNSGQRLLQGQGFTDAYIWNYLAAPDALPTPSHIYWQPLPSLAAWLGMLVFGPTFGAAQVPFVLMASALPLVTYQVAMGLSGERRHARLAALLTVFSGFYLVFWTTTEAFTPFALIASLTLLLLARARQSSEARVEWRWLVVGALVGLGHLTRADGLLLFGVAVIVAVWPRRSWQQIVQSLGLLIAGYVLVMSPWLVRNLLDIGRPLPTGGLDALFLVEYNDLFLFDSQPSLHTYFDSGLSTILAGKGRALTNGFGTFLAVHNLIFLMPFTLVGWWRRRRHAALLPALLYGVALYAAMTLAFTFPGMRGGLFHSGGALLPFIMPVALLGLDDVLGWVTRHRRTWNRQQARRVFGVAFVVFAAALSSFLVVLRIVGPASDGIAWNQQDAVYREIGAYLTEMGAGDALVMSNSPPGFYYHTGQGGVPLPSGDEATLIAAARAYGVQYIVVDKNVVLELQSLYEDGPASDDLLLLADGPFRRGDPVYLYRLVD